MTDTKMSFKDALIAHLQGEKVEVYGVFTAYDGECGKWEWRDFGKYYANLELRNVHLRSSADNIKYRLAPRTIFVNGVEVPAPESVAPKEGCFVYVADQTSNLHHFCIKWVSVCEQYIEYLKRGLVYLNKEDAIARAKAMLITK